MDNDLEFFGRIKIKDESFLEKVARFEKNRVVLKLTQSCRSIYLATVVSLLFPNWTIPTRLEWETKFLLATLVLNLAISRRSMYTRAHAQLKTIIISKRSTQRSSIHAIPIINIHSDHQTHTHEYARRTLSNNETCRSHGSR